jgi:hypothetical protein
MLDCKVIPRECVVFQYKFMVVEFRFQMCTCRDKQAEITIIRASLGTTFSQGIFTFPREISSFSLGKIEIPWENGVPKLALKW